MDLEQTTSAWYPRRQQQERRDPQAYSAVGIDVGVEATTAAVGRRGCDSRRLPGVFWRTVSCVLSLDLGHPGIANPPLLNLKENYRVISTKSIARPGLVVTSKKPNS